MATKNTQQSSATIKQEREAKRLEKVEAFKAQQRRAKRNRLIITLSSIVGGVLVIAVVVAALVLNNKPTPVPTTAAGDIGVVKSFPGLEGAVHVTGPVDYQAQYGMNPPAGGDHNAIWLNCGVYTEPVPNENAVHDLEHGAVWITYDAASLSKGDVTKLQNLGTDPTYQGYITVSPYVGLPAPLVASAWGFQVDLDSVDDPRLTDFITKYLLASTAREPGAPCSGGLDGPGRIG